MKKISFFIILSLLGLSLISSHLFAATRGIRVVAKSGESLYLYKDYHALVVGVSNYEKWPDLPNAAKDAVEVASILENFEFDVKLILNPTAKKLNHSLSDMTFRIGSEKNRALLFYFAGHGETLELADGTELGYIIPSDCPLKRDDPIGFDDKAISMKEVEAFALKVKSKHFLMIFDSCFSGSLFNLVRAAPVDITEKSAQPVRQFITAGGVGEQVPDRSVFKIVFLDGIKGYADLDGDGYITGSELGMHLQDKVVNYTRGGQHPQYGKINNPKLDKGDFIFRLASSGAIVEEPGRASLSVESSVSGASVFVDGRVVGRTPVIGVPLSSGMHKVRVEKDGYEPYRRSIRLEEGLSLSLYVDLSKQRPRMGRLFVETEPEDARIKILNIRPRFYQGMELEPGSYHVEVSADGYQKKSMWVTLDAVEDKNLNIRLKRVATAQRDRTFTNSIGMKLAYIPPGTFIMGSPSSEKWHESEERQHRVTLSKGFYMQTTEVTQDQWHAIMGTRPWSGERAVRNNADCPAVYVTWNDCQNFIRRLNQKEGTNKYRLPTEAEWEYACRAGSTTTYHFGESEEDLNTYQPLAWRIPWELDSIERLRGIISFYESDSVLGDYAWYFSNTWDAGEKYAHTVGNKKANAWGLYDMHGNVREWCEDWYGDYPTGHVTDPKGPFSGKYHVHVLRGGGWNSTARGCRAALRGKPALQWDEIRFRIYTDNRHYYSVGFRLARDF